MSLSVMNKEWITKALVLVLAVGFVVFLPCISGAQLKKTVAVLPFTLYTPQPSETLKRSLQDMFYHAGHTQKGSQEEEGGQDESQVEVWDGCVVHQEVPCFTFCPGI